MTLGNLVPWTRKDRSLALQDRGSGYPAGSEFGPFLALHQEMNRLFDDVFRRFETPLAMAGRGWPTLEVQETDDGYRVTAELPGMDERDVEVSFQDGVLIIRGEKRSEGQQNDRTVSERFYGRFERRIALGDVDEEKASASFDRGVLTVALPKAAEAQARARRIPINQGTQH